jgi:hypothetical protein
MNNEYEDLPSASCFRDPVRLGDFLEEHPQVDRQHKLAVTHIIRKFT